MNREIAKKKATELVEKMTLEEQASQLRYDAPAIDRLNVPAYNWWNEGLHGVARAGTATMFPQAIGLAATFDQDLLHDVGRAIGVEGRAKYNFQAANGDRDIYKGLTFWSPNVNIFRDPRWGRGHETYGEDPTLTARLGVSFVKGLQGDYNPDAEDGEDGGHMLAAACAKHFAVHSGPEALRHKFDATATKRDMEETYLPAFEACVKEADVEAIMGAYNRTNGEPCCGSQSLQEILRDTWGFKGHFVSDCWAIRDFHENHKITDSVEESVALALKNGCDLNCGCTYQKLLDAVEDGLIDPEDIKKSCIRLFTTRYLLGMFEETEYDELGLAEVESMEHLQLADQATAEGLVLLKNNGLLPLKKENLKTIGVIGPNADSREALMGNYHGYASRYITVLEGIQDEVGYKHGRPEDIRVLYSQGCHLFKDNMEPLSDEKMSDRIAEARTVAAASDVTILVLGLDEGLEGEEGDTGNAYASGDKKDLHLPIYQEELMHEILNQNAHSGKPTIVINVSGSAIDLSLPQNEADAVIQAFYPGAHGGAVIADVLFGKCSPSGKLPVTFYYDTHDLPAFEDYSMKGRTYRYYKGETLYPFGYGLTYGKAQVTSAEVVGKDSRGLTLRAKLSNTGAETDEVLQVYVMDEDSEWVTVNPALAAFKRVHLADGSQAAAETEVEILVPEHGFTTVDEDGVRVVRGHHFSLYVGFSQPDARSCQLMETKPVKVNVER